MGRPKAPHLPRLPVWMSGPDCRSSLAAEALVGDVLCDHAVRERDRLVLEVDAAALAQEAGSAERVGGDLAVLEHERTARWAVGVVDAVEDAAAAGAPARAAGIDGVPAHAAVAQRRRPEDVEGAAPDVDGAEGGRGVDMVVADEAVGDRAAVEHARAP